MFAKVGHNAVMYSALFSKGPHPDLADKLTPFGQFVGSWDVKCTEYLPDGSTQTVKGEAFFSWALEGRAIVDVWILPRRELRAKIPNTGDYGVTIRFYNPEIDTWHSTWIGPAKHFVFPFVGRFVDGEIVLEGRFGGEILIGGSNAECVSTRRIISEISPDSLKWQAIQSNDNWATHLFIRK